MNTKKDSYVPLRNITPNYIRYKRKNSHGKGSTLQQNNNGSESQKKNTSKNSKCSYQTYEKRKLNISKLKSNLNLKKKLQQKNLHESTIPNKKINQLNKSRRNNSNQKNDTQRQNIVSLTQRTNDTYLSKKKNIGGSGSNLKRYSRDKNSSQKYSQESLEKQQHRAKLMNVQLINNLMVGQNYLNKLKIKKSQNYQKKKKKKLLNCNIEIKSQQILKHYQIFGQLGKGAYGIVRMGIDKRNDQKVAIKVYDKKKLDEVNKIKNLQRQINILSILDHQTIAKLIQTIQTPTQIYLILQYGGANSLYNYLLSKPQHRMVQSQAKQFLKIIAQTLLYLHNLNIIHRDIKAQNILLNRHKQLKLIDFGFSLQSKPPATIDTFCGTPTYMAPEIVSKQDHVPIYTDMWSLGILFYVMLQGNYPFRAKTQNQLFEKIKQGNFEYIHNDISNRAKFLIESLLKINPLQRLKIKDIVTNDYIEWYDQV